MERFAKYSNFYSIDFFHFFAKRRKSVKKMAHRKKNMGHRTSKIVKSTQSHSNGHLPYYCSLHYLARALDEWRGVRSKDAQKQLARTSLMPTQQTYNKYKQLLIVIISFCPCKHMVSDVARKKLQSSEACWPWYIPGGGDAQIIYTVVHVHTSELHW